MIYGAYLASAIASLVFDDGIARAISQFGYCVITASLLLLAYGRIRRDAATQDEPEDAVPEVLVSDREKYGNNRLPDFVRKSIIDRLSEYMNNEQPWLKIDLTLSELAAAINLNPHHLSQIINSEFGKSFACFINEYRVNAARELLAVNDNKTVIEIALESGFASKSSFNALFKKHTGVTPSEYRRMSRDHSGTERLQAVS
jgi:AraC-like DNA-binding protein